MWQLRYSDDAIDDIRGIARYISERSQDAEVGNGFAERIHRRCEHLAGLSAMLGRARPELRPDIRSVVHGNYMVFIRYLGQTLEIVNVLEGSRDLDAFFLQGHHWPRVRSFFNRTAASTDA